MNDIQAELRDLRNRIDRLERQNQRLRRIWMMLPLAALLVLLPGAMRPAQKLQLEPVKEAPPAGDSVKMPVVAPKFVVQDANGKVRALLDDQGLFLFGPNRQLELWLTSEDLVYKGDDGRIRLALKASKAGSSLTLRDAQGDEADLGDTTLTSPGGASHRPADSLLLIRHGTVVRSLP